MGREETDRHKAHRAALSICAAALAFFVFALAATAQAAPTHPRKEALDTTGLNHACGAAVDSKGDLYLASAGDSKIKVYNAAHTLLTEISDSNQPCGLAVTTTGNLYVTERATGEVVRFKPNAYPFAGTPTYGPREVIDSSAKAKGIAVDPFDNRLYVAEGDRVSTYGSEGNLGIDEVQKVSLNSGTTGGTFKLEFGGQKTAAIAFNASAEEVKTALTGLSTIGVGNVSIEKPKEKEYLVTFVGALAHTDVAMLVGDASGLTGTTPKVNITEKDKGFSGRIGEGTLTEASGVAIYSYPNEAGVGRIDRYLWVADASGVGADRLYLFGGADVRALALRREVDGATTPDGSFGFGTAGAYLAADPGNRNSKGECKVVGEQACTAGHLFLYDAAHKALDEFDATGEYLDRTANAAFADAEPTAIAIERSGAANDGTLYVTAGAGAGAKALAFGPLKAPSRAALGTPLSHILSNARAVATDSHGDVYAAAGSEIHIYDTAGQEITSIEDPGKPLDLAVDSAGNVYVLDENGGFINEYEVTYYAPSEYPPEAGTIYERLEPAIVTAADFPGDILKAIAVDPGSEEGKDRLFVTGNASVHEYDTAENGSVPPLSEEFGQCAATSQRGSLAVDGARGIVYIAGNPRAVYAVSEAGGEFCLARFENTGPSTTVGANPVVAVDQSNGHVITFDQTKGAREYDAAGSFVAEFGSFTESARSYRVAIDNACALHEPPLDETTTPTCKAFDPANGNVYIAYDDPNASNPPYDVTAFGPLRYGPGNEKFALTVVKSGTGTGKVTSIPAGIDCGGTCSAEFEEGKVVELKQEASPGSEFVKWGGPCSGSGVCKVAISEAKSVTAEFKSTPKVKFKLTVSKTGAGSGKVTSTPAGIDCGSTCSAEFDKDTEVTLSATPESGSVFSGWSGSGCSGTGTCKVTMSEAKSVTAAFALEQHLLSVTKKGTGSGTVTSSPAGINCGSECSANFNHGTAVTLTGTPGAKTKAVVWSGCDSVNGENKCLVTMTSAKSVTATFDLEPTAKFKLTVSKTGAGSGKVTSTPAGIDCGSTCSAEFDKDTEVTLSATPESGSVFSGWSGSGCSGTGTCKVTMSEAKSVTAAFALEQHLLSVTKKGTGSGTVTSSPAGINCGSECSANFNHGTAVTLTGTPGAKTKAVVWSGCDSVNGENKCLVTMTSAKSVTATFDLEPTAKFKLTVSKTGAGSGKVTSTPAGIDCGSTCSAEFDKDTEVTLSATPESGSVFSGWSGSGCSGTGTCKVTMSEAKSVTAAFALEQHLLSVTKKGTGSGTVTSSPAGINCGSECSANFNHGTAVTLTGTPGAKTKAVVWSGCDSVNGENKCLVTMTSAKSVTATFDLEPTAKFKLTVSKTGAGSGKVTSTPAGIDCGSTCSAEFDKDTEVTLSATPESGSEFRKWGGVCEEYGASPTCEVTLTEAAEATAFFAHSKRALTVKQEGSGVGSISSKPKAVKCASTCTQAVASLYKGTTVVLTAKATSGSKLSSWSGCESETKSELEGTCTVSMSAAKEVKAVFGGTAKAILNPVVLSFAKATGTGKGTVKATGLTCEADCTSTEVKYTSGDGGKKLPAKVILKEAPAVGSSFTGWTGCESNPTPGECVVTTSAAKEVTAGFDALPTKTLTVAQEGSGVGSISSKPKGIKCASTCTSAVAELPEGTTVVLTAKATTGSKLSSWSGCESETKSELEGTCTVKMSAAKEVKAVFGGTAKAILNPVVLTLTKAGTGYGTVKATGLTCEVACTSTEVKYTSGDGGKKLPAKVILKATSQAGSDPVSWTGCESNPTPGECVVTTSAAKEVTATFEE